MSTEEIKLLLLAKLRQNVNSDYILLDLPYYTNVGDVLIWQSTLDLLKQIDHRCLYSSSIETYRKPDISKDVLIIFMGGGNFGDVWKRHQIFRQQVLKDFPYNPVLQLPQSVYFENSDFLSKDITIFASHIGKITIACRDQFSCDFMTDNYKFLSVELWPDLVLAFNINRYATKDIGRDSILVQRNDSETIMVDNKNLPYGIHKADWPTLSRMPLYLRVHDLIISKIVYTCSPKLYRLINDFMYKNIYKQLIMKSGINFLNKYRTIYSTRLHVTILAALLEKEVITFDNSYRKIKGVYELWMKDWKNIKTIF